MTDFDHANDPAVQWVLSELQSMSELSDDAGDYDSRTPFGTYAKVQPQPNGFSVLVFPDPDGDPPEDAPGVPAVPVVRITVERIA